MVRSGVSMGSRASAPRVTLDLQGWRGNYDAAMLDSWQRPVRPVLLSKTIVIAWSDIYWEQLTQDCSAELNQKKLEGSW